MENLGSFSHVWLLWVFHQNPGNCSVKAKVSPPRLDGQRVGVFSSRSPHRPANIGLSLVRLDAVVGATLQLSGVDLVQGTPVLDIKPFIPTYDSPCAHGETAGDNTGGGEDYKSTGGGEGYKSTGVGEGYMSTGGGVRVPGWVAAPEDNLAVVFSVRAEEDLARLDCDRLSWLRSTAEVRRAVSDVLRSDPRSVYRKQSCEDRLYYTILDTVHVTAW